MTQQNPYLELVKSDVASEVQSSMQSAADKNPDTEAKLQSLAKAANVPVDTARLDQPAVQRQVDLSLDYKKLAERYPSTVQLLTDPANAALAKDDLPAVSRLEDTLNFGINMFRSVGAATTAASEGLYGVAQAGAESAASLIDPLVGTVLPQNPFEVMADKIRNWRQIAKSDTKVIEGDQAGMGFVQQSALSGVKSLGQSLLLAPLAIATGQPELLLYPMAAMTGGQAYGEARDKNVPVSGSLAFSASQGMIEYATERIPAITLLRDVGLQSSFKKMLVNQVVHEVPGEQVATVFQDLNEWAVLHPEKPFSDYLKERPSAAAQTLIATIVATGGQAGIGAAASRVANGSRQQQTVDMLTALKDGVMDSKTFARAPERIKSFIEQHTKNGPVENIFIPAEQYTQYFQTQQIDPQAAADEMGAKNYAEAVSTGGDVVIPLADFVANVAKTPHYDGLINDIRFSQGEMTARELHLYERNHPDEVKRMVEEAKNFQLPSDSPVITQITDDITGQLVADGMPRDTADTYATLYAKTIANLAQRSGKDPLALHQKYGLEIIRPMADVLTRLKTSDIQIDPLLDRLRSGDVPTDATVNGPALMEFLRGIGGLKDTGGELRRMEVDTGIAPFVKNLIQQIDGKGLDEAAALAQEAGYPVQDILDAIAQEVQGKPIYSAHNANENLLGLQRDLHNLGEYLHSIGVDLASATNEQVRQAMAAAIGNIYDQSAAEFFRGMGIEAGATEKQVNQYHDEVAWKNYGTDEKTGFPVWSSDKIGLQNPRDVTETHDVFYKPPGNERAAKYDIHDATGKKVGYTVLELDGDMPTRLLDIQIDKSEQGKQHAENTVAAVAADAGELGIWHIIDSARSWWDRIGARTIDEYDGAINFRDYADARAGRENARGLGEGLNQTKLYQSHSGSTITVDGVDRPTTSNDGKPLAHTQQALENFWRWFGDSKVVDEQGRPIGVFHGTTANFDTFNRERANPESDLGAGFYFTNTEGDVDANYAGIGPDLKAKIEREAERIASETDREYDDPEVIAEATAKYVQNDGITLPVYLKMENPVEIGGPRDTFFDYEQPYNEENDEYGDEQGKLVDFIVALRNIADRYHDGSVDGAINAMLENGDGMHASRILEILKADEQFGYYADENGNLVSTELMREAFETAGFDGFIDHTVNQKFGSERRIGQKMTGMHEETVHYIAFEPTQIKSATDNRGTFDAGNPSILFQSGTNNQATGQGGGSNPAPVFYSALQRALPQLAKIADKSGMVKPEQVTQWLASRQKEGKFKAAELEWSGLPEMLAAQSGKVSVADIEAFARDNGVQVQEVVKGAPRSLADITDADRQAAKQYFDVRGFDDMGVDQQNSYVDEMRGHQNKDKSNTKYEKYTLPGGENYRELLLTLPKVDDIRQAKLDRINAKADTLPPAGERTPAQEQLLLDLTAEHNAVADAQNAGDFHHVNHWSEPNILAHIRFNERTDADGKRVLFIEELQSDWGQQGKKKGFSEKRTEWPVEFSNGDVAYYKTEAEARRIAEANGGTVTSAQSITGIPAAPFVTDTKNWLALGIKRMVRYAAENGFDKVAFINGEQAADRFDLSKQIQNVQATKTLQGAYHIKAVDNNGRVVLDDVYGADGLPDVIGKDLAEKVVAEADKAHAEKGIETLPDDYQVSLDRQTDAENPYTIIPPGQSHGRPFAGRHASEKEAIDAALARINNERSRTVTFSGLDLKVGGDGMKAFYDTIVPQVANDVLKKVGGGKMGEVSMTTDNALTRGMNYSGPELSLVRLRERQIEMVDNLPSAVLRQMTEVGMAMDTGGLSFTQAMEAYASPAAAKALGGTMENRQAAANPQPGFDITPAMRESVMGGQALFQSAVKPIATLSGDELGTDLSADNVVERARDWFKGNLQGKSIEREGLGPVRVSGKGWAKLRRGLTTDLDKARLIPAIANLIQHGQYSGRQPLNKERTDDIVAFHYFTGAVDLAGKSILAGVTVAEDSHGNLFYNLNQNPQALQEKTKASHLPGIDSAQDARLSKDGKTTLDQSIDQSGDEINITILTQSKDVKRGFIQFGPDRKFKIGLLEDVNLSTFLHETGHFWLEVMGDLAQQADASQEIKDDYAAILKFLKVESREQIGVEQHEMFARANEAYLREGKAPSPELRGMFQRFKAWLEMIYKAADELNVKLNDEVRGVFDRLYASDAEIEAAKHELDVSALLTSASQASMSDAEFAAYQKSLEGEIARAKDELGARLMRQFQRERNKWWKDELAKFEADVTAEVDAQIDQNAFTTLVNGALPDGTFIKLDKAELLEKYGKEYIKRLPRGKQAVYDSKGKGWALQDAAELLGFQTGDELVQALVNLRPRKELIAAEAKARMVKDHGDMLTDGTIHDEATEALHNEERAKRLAFELKVIRRKQREVKPFVNAAMQQDKQQAQAATDVPPIQAFRDAARGLIGQKQVRDLSPYSYLLAERKASKNAFEAMAKKDYQTAAIEKQRELLNHHLFLEATRAREEVDAIVSHMAKLGKTAARERIGKAGHDYLDQIDTLLEQYQFQNVSQRQIDRRKSLIEWYQEQVDNGFEPVIDAELLANARSLSYKELPVDQVRAINDAVRSIEHLASLKNKLLANKKGMEFDQAVDELVTIAEDNNGKVNRPYDPEQRTTGEKTADWFAAKDRALVNVRTMVAWLDGGKVDGPWHTLLFNPSSDAQTAQLDMMKSVGKPVNDLMEKYMEGAGERMLDRFTTPLGVVSRKFLMSIAFNLGSESSFDKMLRGGPGGRVEGGGRVQWNEATIRGMVANLDAKDWKFVQGIWTILDTKMYPQINELTKRVSGVPLEKVVAKPFTVTTRDGETIHLDGGYYPLKYDPKFSQAGLKQESGPLAGLTEVGYSSATTSRGHTKARIEGFAAPLLFDFTHILQVHLANAIKDLTHREFLMDAQKILRNDRIRQVLQERIGTQYEGEFMSWLKRIANDGNSMPDMNFMDKFVEVARTNATIVSLGYKVSTIIAQAGGLFNAIEHPNVGPGWFYRGLSESTRHPVESYAMVVKKSGEMRHRFDTIDQTVREVLSKVQTTKYGKLQDGITRSAFIGINIADRMVTIPTWIAAYRKAVASGIAEEEAIHAADDAVVGSQGAGAAKDINSVQAARGAIKAFTMFYTPFAAQYNRMRSIGRAAGQQGWKYTPEAAMRVMMITFFPAVLMDLLTSRGPTHCDASDAACYAKWLAVKMVSSQTATLPFIRDIGNGLEQYVSGKQGNVKISPLIMALDKVWGSVKHGFESYFGDRQFDQTQAFDIFESSGYLMGLPTGQARITGEYLTDLVAGNNSPDSVGSFLHDLVFRKEKK